MEIELLKSQIESKSMIPSKLVFMYKDSDFLAFQYIDNS